MAKRRSASKSTVRPRSKASRSARPRSDGRATRAGGRRTRTRAAAAGSGDARTIVYVHGIGNKPEAAVLCCQWDHALFGFELGERSRMAYWVNRVYYPTPLPETCGGRDLVKVTPATVSVGAKAVRGLTEDDIEAEIQALTQKPSEQEVLREIARDIEREANRRAPRGPGAAATREAEVRALTTRGLNLMLVRDVYDFLFDDNRRQVMRDSLLSRLRAGGGPFVVIGHSQGSMIAYDVLSQLSPEDADIALFVTIGSPLGIGVVEERLRILTGQRRLKVPRSVRRWVNVSDPRDPVALDENLADDYAPNGAVRVEDVQGTNPDSPQHPHSGSGYLRMAPVKIAVNDATDTALFQPVASFTMARDLANAMENSLPEERQEVLIELVEPANSSGQGDLETSRARVLASLLALQKQKRVDLEIAEMRRYVAACLTREETETLSVELGQPGANWAIKRVWRNAVKHALIDQSAGTVHVTAAHSGYKAFGEGITWAVLDSGVVKSHPHFSAFDTVKEQFDFTRSQTKDDEHGHGTHVAGIIAGQHTVGEGSSARMFSGMAPRAKIYSYKVLNRAGEGRDSWIIQALDDIADRNEKAGALVIHGINLSLGGPFDQSTYGCGHSPLCSELRRLWRQGVIVVIAGGNEGFANLQTPDGEIGANMDLSMSDPANLAEAIAVGSVHKINPHTYGVSYFSSRGPTADGRQKPDLVAPGERILSCRYQWRQAAARVQDLYVEMSGTSMAAPHVSGILAAFLSLRREFIGYPDRVKEILLKNCTDITRERTMQGAGIPNLVKMLVMT
jgi:subtilisin family serine protease